MSRSRRRYSKPTQPSSELQRLVELEVSRALSQSRPIAQGKLDMPAKPMPGSGTMASLLGQMQMQEAPAKQGPIMYPPGAPVQPTPGLVDPAGLRQFAYPIGYNIELQPRSTESMTFETLRNLAALYDGIMLCEQVWLDIVSKLTLVVKPRNELVTAKADTGDQALQADIQRYTDFFSYPDRVNGLDLKSWMRMALRDQLQLDAVAIYPRRDRAGGLFSLELIDGSSIKVLLDPRGRRPEPPYPAYQQFLYGVPAGLYTADELLYIRETPRSDSPYGLSRVERIILRINQALRKQNKDLARFTEGNIPPGILEPPDDGGSQWTPEQLAAYQQMWDAMLAGNDQLRSRVKVVQPGSKYTQIVEPDIFVDFDRFLMNVTTACYSMTMADLGFTETVNKSSGDSQENVFYRRAVQPLMDRYAVLFTAILKNYFNDDRFIVTWSGFEEAEDFASQASAYVALVGAGIISPSVAARLLKLPVEKDIPPFVLTKDGPVFLEDAADPAMRGAANDAKKAGYALAASPPSPPPVEGDEEENKEGQSEPNSVGAHQDDKEEPGNDKAATQSDDKPPSPESGANKADKEKPDPADKQGKPSVQRSVDNEVHNTGIMVAFMVKPEIAEQLAIPDGEDPGEMHCTLAYLGKVDDTPKPGKLNPASSLSVIGTALSAFAQGSQTLIGSISGIGRFVGTADKGDPVIALVNVQGLQDFRGKLVDVLETTGYCVASNYDYTPHITLAYIDPSEPTPDVTLPGSMLANDGGMLPAALIFDELCLVIGDDRRYFKLGETTNEWPVPIGETVNSDFFRSDQRKARPPSTAQLALETELAKAIQTFIEKTTVTKDGAEPPGETEQTKLLHTITDALEAAVDEGKRIAGNDERGIVSSAKNLAGRAVQIVGGIVSQIRDKVAGWLGAGEDTQSQLADWAPDYSEVVAITEIHGAVEEAVLDTWEEQGVNQVYWVTDENPCAICEANAEVSPIAIGDAWPDGSKAPPGHVNCRCTTAKG